MRLDSVKVILFILVSMLVLSGAASASEQSADGAAAVRAELSKLPLSFIPNQGQADPAVLFQVKAEGHTIFLTKDNVVLVTDKDGTPVSFSTTVAGANPAATVVGVDQLPGTASFFIGNDPAYWQSGLVTYGGVEYKNILPGVDLTYCGNNGVLKREFVVAPGADASVIVIVYDGVDGLAYGPDGTLQVQTPAGVLTETAPVCYQVINGNMVNIPAQYNILGNGRVGFNLGLYDKAYPLVIDPALVYSSYLGGAVNDAANGIAVDSLGQAYVTGYTDSTNFPRNYTTSHLNGCSDVFVTKVSKDGKFLIYSTYLGGDATDVGNGIAIDETGKAFITGYTTSLNFPLQGLLSTAKNPEISPFPCPLPGCIGQADAFLMVLSPSGTTLPISTCFGGNMTDVGTSVAVQPDGNWVYLTGFTNSNNTGFTWPTVTNNFPLSFDAIQPLLNQGCVTSTACDAFIISYQYNGFTSPPSYSSYWGGNESDQGLGIALDYSNIPPSTYYVTGWTQSDNFMVGGAPSYYKGGKDVFVSQFTDPNVLIYSTYLGGEGNDEGRGIAVANINGGNYAYITGVTYSNSFPTTPDALFEYPNWGTSSFGDAFITRLDPTTGSLNWSTYLGGINGDGGNSIALDTNRNVYITGYTSSTNFPISHNPIPTFGTKHAFQDAFITMVNSNLTSLNFSSYLGGELDETGTGIAVNDTLNLFVSGYTTSTDFPTVNSFKVPGGPTGNHFAGWVDGFVVHINNLPTPAFPIASFNYTPHSGSFDLDVTFTDTSTGSPDHWRWDFGDGSPIVTVTGPPIPLIHTYTTPGTFYVNLEVWNALGTNSTPPPGSPVVVTTPAAPKIANCNSTVGIDRVLLAENSTRNLSLLLWYTQNGMSTYNVTLGFNDTLNTTFKDAHWPAWMPAPQLQWRFDPVSLQTDPYNVTVAGVDFSTTKSNYNVSLGCFQIYGNQSGESLLILKNYTLQDYDFNFFDLTPRYANVTIVVKKLYPIPITNPNYPTDIDMDNLYEDVNGDHQRNYLDVICFFQNYPYISSTEYWEFFDFNHNGHLDPADTIGLFRIIYG